VVGNTPGQVKVSELTVDMYLLLQALEMEIMDVGGGKEGKGEGGQDICCVEVCVECGDGVRGDGVVMWMWMWMCGRDGVM